ncbi:MAG: 3'-5' exonuclease, partial [Rhodoferax sp.]|nr:3'-5' exonuclease [Rhodoferax sp.]
WPELDALLRDEAAWDTQVERFLTWQQLWRSQGVLPMLHRLLHEQGLAQRLLQQGAAGERALTNVLHLGELLQAASSSLQGEGALLRHLEAQLRRPAANAETAQLRLESDAELVQVVTLHKSKGLQYPLVFLPFLSSYRAETQASSRPDAERLAEDVRLLYVALTRAQRALWLGVAQVSGDVEGKKPEVKSALSKLLARSTPDDLAQRLATWGCADIAVQTAPAASDMIYAPALPVKVPQGALPAQRVLRRNWWSASFSALTRDLQEAVGVGSDRDQRVADAQLDSAVTEVLQPATPAVSELFVPEVQFNAFPAGSSYGTLLHDLLEWQAEHGWPAAQTADALDANLRSAWASQLSRASQRAALTPEQQALLESWVAQILMTNWPLALMNQARTAINNVKEQAVIPGYDPVSMNLKPWIADQVRNDNLLSCSRVASTLWQLGSLKPGCYWSEMGFTLPVQRLGSAWLDQRISQQVWPGQPRAALQPRTLEGLLTGFMDLVFECAGRYYVLDYKSNRLSDYAPATLQAAMLAHRYDVQAVLYVLALHRLLKSRLADYNFDRHLGGALYWFVRGVDQSGAGLLAITPPRALIDVLDAALSQPALAGSST